MNGYLRVMDDLERLKLLEIQIRNSLECLVFRATAIVLVDLHKKRNLN